MVKGHCNDMCPPWWAPPRGAGHDVTSVYCKSMVLELAGGRDGSNIRKLMETRRRRSLQFFVMFCAGVRTKVVYNLDYIMAVARFGWLLKMGGFLERNKWICSGGLFPGISPWQIIWS